MLSEIFSDENIVNEKIKIFQKSHLSKFLEPEKVDELIENRLSYFREHHGLDVPVLINSETKQKYEYLKEELEKVVIGTKQINSKVNAIVNSIDIFKSDKTLLSITLISCILIFIFGILIPLLLLPIGTIVCFNVWKIIIVTVVTVIVVALLCYFLYRIHSYCFISSEIDELLRYSTPRQFSKYFDNMMNNDKH